MVKYRVDFTEMINGQMQTRCDMVSGDVTAVQEHLDRFAWIVDTVTVTEYVGSDAVGRILPTEKWCQD